ncbi:MAG: AMP-binding enzyme, partial [Candidatus Binatia bacterium]
DPPERGAETEGRAIWAGEVRIVGDDGIELAPGREGEVLGRGPDCFLGYRDAALDAEAFAPEGWFRTGDLGVVDREGYLTITGRKKDIVIRKGEKISAAELESLIGRHPAVADVAVVALPDRATGERACACVILRPGESLDLEGLGAFLRSQRLPAHKLPEALEVVRELPRTASGKVQKERLRALLLGAARRAATKSPRPPNGGRGRA